MADKQDKAKERKILALEEELWDIKNIPSNGNMALDYYYRRRDFVDYSIRGDCKTVKMLAMKHLWRDINYVIYNGEGLAFGLIAENLFYEIYAMVSDFRNIPRSILWDIGFELYYKDKRVLSSSMLGSIYWDDFDSIKYNRMVKLLEKAVETRVNGVNKVDRLIAFGQDIIREWADDYINKQVNTGDGNIPVIDRLSRMVYDLIILEEIKYKDVVIKPTFGYYHVTNETLGQLWTITAQEWQEFVGSIKNS